MRFVVIGAGAVGGVVGGRLRQGGHEVVLVARGDHGEAIARDGLHLHSPSGTDRLAMDVVSAPNQVRWDADDVVLLAVKGQDTAGVVVQLADAADDTVPIVCLQNGVDNERQVLRRFGQVYGATVMCPTVHLEPGHVVAYSAPTTGVIDVGRYPTGAGETAVAIATALSRSTFSSEVQDDIAAWKWRKLVTNVGNAIEAVCGPPARQGPIGEMVRAEAERVLAAARIASVSVADDRARRGDHLRVQPVDGRARPGGSTWQSLARRAGSVETDHLNGEIVLLGRLHGIPTPVNLALQRHVRRMVRDDVEPGTVGEDEFLAEVGG